MFLIKDWQHSLRLMSYKSNPWLKFDEAESENESEIEKHTTFKFTGGLNPVPKDHFCKSK